MILPAYLRLQSDLLLKRSHSSVHKLFTLCLNTFQQSLTAKMSNGKSRMQFPPAERALLSSSMVQMLSFHLRKKGN